MELSRVKFEAAGGGSGKGVFFLVLQTKGNIYLRRIGFGPVVPFIIDNFNGIYIVQIRVVSCGCYIYFTATAAGSDIAVDGQADLSYLCFVVSQGCGSKGRREKAAVIKKRLPV